MKYFLLVLFLFFAAFPLFSQETAVEYAENSDDNTLYVIAGYEFSVKGRSRPSALLYKLIEQGEFREGELIIGKENLEKHISDITQIYINQRVLKDNVEVNYSTGPGNVDGSYLVTIMIKVEDSLNIIALPKPEFKVGDYYDITIKARDYNFFGTMHALRIDAGWNYDEQEDRHSFMFGVFFDTTFKVFGFYWNLTFDNTIKYHDGAPVSYQNFTGLSVDLPFYATTFTFGIEESIHVNEENTDWTEEVDYNQYHDGLYMSSRLYVSWKIPTGLIVSRFGELTYTPVLSSTFNHDFPEWPLEEFRRGIYLGFSHSLDFGKIDWHANYREGLSFSIGNSYSYNFLRNIYDISFNASVIGHYIVSDFFAVSSRFMYKYWYSSDETSSGGNVSSNMRGINDDSITAYQTLLLNMDLPFRLFIFMPSQWFNSKKLSFFDFELHASPVIDLAVYYQKGFDKGRTMFYPMQIAAAGGLELVVFPLFMRNLYVRVGFAVNLKEFITARPLRIPDGNNREIYLIMGHLY
jgi:hypothetical protein